MASEKQETTNEEVVRRLIDEVWSQGNLDAADELVTDNYVEHDPSLSEDVQGRKEFKQNVAEFREALSGLEKHIEEIVTDGDTVAVEYTFVGTHDAELWDVEPTGQEVRAKGMFFFHLDDGKIDEVTHLWNSYGTLQQIGAISESTTW